MPISYWAGPCTVVGQRAVLTARGGELTGRDQLDVAAGPELVGAAPFCGLKLVRNALKINYDKEYFTWGSNFNIFFSFHDYHLFVNSFHYPRLFANIRIFDYILGIKADLSKKPERAGLTGLGREGEQVALHELVLDHPVVLAAAPRCRDKTFHAPVLPKTTTITMIWLPNTVPQLFGAFDEKVIPPLTSSIQRQALLPGPGAWQREKENM